MKILAIEFSSLHRSVAVAERPDVTGAADSEKVQILGEASEGASRATPVFALISRALASGNTRREEISCLVIGLGPGSYTGIRLAISVAQGWQLARNTPVLGISSADCIAAGAMAGVNEGRRIVVIDAQRGEFYTATYEAAKPFPRIIEPLHLACAKEIERRIQEGGTIIGPDIQKLRPGEIPYFPQASTLARLSSRETQFLDGSQLEPIYLRATTFVKAPAPRANL